MLHAMALLWLPWTATVPAAAIAPAAATIAPLTATISGVVCPGGYFDVTVHNGDARLGRSYTLYANDRFLRTEVVAPGTRAHSRVRVSQGLPMTIQVMAANRVIAAATRTVGCGTTASPGAVPPGPPGRSRRLPLTGSGAAATALAATGLGTVTTGGLLLFYALLWPRSGRGDWESFTRRTG